MTVYPRRPWWRARAFGVTVSVLGYLLLVAAMCATAALVMR